MPDDLDWLKSWVAENNTSATQDSESEKKLSELRDLMGTTARGPEPTDKPPQPNPSTPAEPKPAVARKPAKQKPATARKPAPSRLVAERRAQIAKMSDRERAELPPCLKLELEDEARARRAAAQKPKPAQNVSKPRGLMAVPSPDSTEAPPRRTPAAEPNPAATQEPSQKVSKPRSLKAVPSRDSAEEPSRREPRDQVEPESAASQKLSELRDLMAKVPSSEAPRRRKPAVEPSPAVVQAPEPAQKVSQLRDLMEPDLESAEEPPRRKSRGRTGWKSAAKREPSGDRESARDRKADERDPAARARDICLNLLTARPRTRSELRQALIRKEIEADVADEVLGRLDDVGLIDDKAFAEMWVHSRHTYQGMGPRALSAELRRRGVDNEVAAEAVAAVDPDAEEERARQLVRKRIPSMSTIDQQAKIRRLVGMLARKGYAQGLAYRVVKDELANLGEETNLLDTLD